MKTFAKWKDVLCLVQPQTVIGWHRAGFRMYWRHKSRRRNGRPAVSVEMRKLIKKINSENPLWSPERIHDQLIDLGYKPPSPNAIRKYLPKPTKDSSKSSQNWKTFLANHMDSTWSMDFAVVPTITFRFLYVFIVVSHERREIVHFSVTRQPTMLWVVQQLREATAFGLQPKYLIRDNDRIYGGGVPTFLTNSGIRRELLDHIIPLNERHLYRLLKEYIGKYYHPVRTHSGLDHRPPIVDPSVEKSRLLPNALLESEPILGGLYHSYRAKAA